MFYSSRNESKISFLDPAVQGQVRELLIRLDAQGEDVLIASGKRTSAEQDALYAQIPPVTHVNDSNSYHTWGMAVDLVPVTLGIAQWNATKRYEAIARTAVELGFEWGFQLWGFDKPHFQFTFGLSIAALKAGARPQVMPAYREEQPPKTQAGREALQRREERKLNRLAGAVKDMLARRIERRLHRQA